MLYGWHITAEEEIGEGGAISIDGCTRSFDELAACGVNDTTFLNNRVARKGGAVAIASGSAKSYVEFQRCTVDSSTTGYKIEDDPQGEGGAFAMGTMSTLLLVGCTISKNYCGKKVARLCLAVYYTSYVDICVYISLAL